jgi:Host cell surface-exposed lipoprotein
VFWLSHTNPFLANQIQGTAMTETLPPPTIEAPTATTKPLWKKKKFFIPIGVVGAFVAIAAVAPSAEENPEVATPNTEVEIAAPIVTEAPVEVTVPVAEAPVATVAPDPVAEPATTIAPVEAPVATAAPTTAAPTTAAPTTAAPDPFAGETVGQKNARQKAASYLDFMAFSSSGLIEQLEFEGFSTEDSAYAVFVSNVDWNDQAAKKAADYLDFTSFSHSGLVEQLVFEGFTQEQAEYGVSTTGL